MKILISLFFIVAGTLPSYVHADPSEEGSTTRAIESNCEDITATRQNGSRIKLEKCEYGFGGIGYNPDSPNYAYYHDGKLFDGNIQKNQHGTYSIRAGQDFETVSDSALPDEFKCDGKNGDELQCLVCNCYHETRGQNYQEKVMVGRVVLSRAMNPIFANSVCGVVHERGQPTTKNPEGVAQFSWIRRSDDNCLNNSCDPDDLNDPGYKVNSLLGNNIGHKTELDRRAYGECINSSKEALTKRNEYFASYYFTGEKPGWAKTCEENYKSRSNRVSTREFAHTFYGVCEESEREFSRILSSPRPKPRPTSPVRPKPNPAIVPGVS